MMQVGQVQVVDQIWWYTSRAAGIVAWLLLSASLISGMTLVTRDSRILPTGWPIDLHRLVSSVALVFLAIHMLALIPDNFVDFGPVELMVPLTSTWQPWAVAWGIVAFWLVLAVEASSLLRKRIPNRVWHIIHFLSFVVWLTATVHLFMAGTDVGALIFRVAQVGVIGAVLVLFMRRLLTARRRSRRLSARRGPLPVEEPVDVDEVHAGER